MGLCQSSFGYSPVVEITQGPIRGREFLLDGKVYDGYMGIPYAKPPIGKLRFQKPQPHDPWTETRDCVKFGPRCPQDDQYVLWFANIVGKSEKDMLTMNVFAPRDPSPEYGKGRPVMVWVHGGGFSIHSSSNYGDDEICRNLCSKDVVVVTFNYRLGAFGFFTTGDEYCRGNQGMWDQVLALQWVQENISVFGGDPKNVTLFGQSAGGASVDVLCMSPYMEGLYHKVIPMSGAAYCYYGERDVRDLREQGLYCKKFARYLGWKNPDENDSEDLFKFMEKQSTSSLSVCIQNSRGCTFHGAMLFMPCQDGELFPHTQPVARPLIPKTKIMTGITHVEGLFFMALFHYGRTLRSFKWFIKHAFTEERYSNLEEVHKRIFNFYTKGIDLRNRKEVVRKFVDLLSDCLINNGMQRYASEMASLGHDVYFYQFNYYNPNGFGWFKLIFPYLDATHTTEVRFVMGKGIIAKFRPSSKDLIMLDQMTDYFTNFAKYGDPNPPGQPAKWEKHSADQPYRYYAIDMESEMKDGFQDRRAEFWKQLLDDFKPVKSKYEVLK